MQYIVMTKKKVYQVNARSYTVLVNALSAAGIEWTHIEQIHPEGGN